MRRQFFRMTHDLDSDVARSRTVALDRGVGPWTVALDRQAGLSGWTGMWTAWKKPHV